MTLTKPRISEEATKYLRTVYKAGLDFRQRYDPLYKEEAKHFNPVMQEWDANPNDIGPVDLAYLYNGVGWKSSIKLADAMHGYAFGRNTPWQRLSPEDPDLAKEEDMMEYLQRLEDHMYRQFAKSPFYDEGRLAVRTCADFGTAIMWRESDEERMQPTYHNLKLARCVILENEYGEADTLFREVWMTPVQAAAFFGEEALPQSVSEAYSNGESKFFRFHHLTFKDGKFPIDVERIGGKPWISLWFSSDGNEEWGAVRQSGYGMKPFWVWRWSRSGDGSPYGVDNPGMIECSTVKQLQGMRKDYHRIVQLTARPQLKASETLQGRIRLIPNGITYLKPGEDYAAAQTVGNPQFMLADETALSEEVRESYYNKLFLVLTQNLENAKRTATEVEGIRAEQSALLTAVSGRLNTEFLECAVEDLYLLEVEHKRFPPPPRRYAGKPLRIDLISPLAILQRQYLRLTPTKQALAEIFAISQMDPSALDHYDLGQYGRVVAEVYNIDRTVLRDLVEVEQIRKKRAEEQKAMMDAQRQELQARAVGKTYGALSKAPESGSPLAAVGAS